MGATASDRNYHEGRKTISTRDRHWKSLCFYFRNCWNRSIRKSTEKIRGIRFSRRIRLSFSKFDRAFLLVAFLRSVFLSPKIKTKNLFRSKVENRSNSTFIPIRNSIKNATKRSDDSLMRPFLKCSKIAADWHAWQFRSVENLCFESDFHRNLTFLPAFGRSRSMTNVERRRVSFSLAKTWLIRNIWC